MLTEDERYIMRALELAGRAVGMSFPNPLVGAVLVSGGEVVGEGYHRGAGNPHAEREAIARAGKRAKGGTLYLNLEPCCHQGRTPPCTEAIIEAGIARVVFSIYDSDERVRGRGAGVLRSHGVDVCTGVCAPEALELNLPYIHRSLTGRTFVLLKLALTLDGCLTSVGRRYLTGEESRRHVHYLRAWTEAIAVGIGTIEKDNPTLDRRLHCRDLPPPLRMIFDTSARFPCSHPWLEKGEGVIVYCLEKAGADRKRCLEETGAEVVSLPQKDGGVDLSAWMDDMSDRGITSVMVEGGGRISTSLIREGLFQRMILFHAPLFSGRTGESFFQDRLTPVWLIEGELVPSRSKLFGADLMTVYDRRSISGYLRMVTEEKLFVHGTG